MRSVLNDFFMNFSFTENDLFLRHLVEAISHAEKTVEDIVSQGKAPSPQVLGYLKGLKASRELYAITKKDYKSENLNTCATSGS